MLSYSFELSALAGGIACPDLGYFLGEPFYPDCCLFKDIGAY